MREQFRCMADDLTVTMKQNQVRAGQGMDRGVCVHCWPPCGVRERRHVPLSMSSGCSVQAMGQQLASLAQDREDAAGQAQVGGTTVAVLMPMGARAAQVPLNLLAEQSS